MSGQRPPIVEEIEVAGKELLATVKNIIRAGNVRRVVIKNPEGRVLLDIPLTAGIVGAVLLPFWAAIGSLAAVAARYTIQIEREAGPPVPVDR